MIAEFDSRCPLCDEEIFAGDQIDLHEDGEWCHTTCIEAES